MPNFQKLNPIKRVKNLGAESRAILCFILFIAVSIGIFSQIVNLTPQVDADFFFSSDNPKFQYDKLISKIFTKQPTQIILSAMGDIDTKLYSKKIKVLTNLLGFFPGVESIKSIASGPRNLKDAENSPLWKRLLVSEDRDSTNVIVFMEDISPQEIIPKFEDAIDVFSAPDFRMIIAGVPYVVEMIRRNLVHDISTFSIVAFLIFGIMIMFIFRSGRILAGTLVACIEACIITLIITSLMGIKIGILTVNISTIVFVLTLSHIVFLTHNWKGIAQKKKEGEGDGVIEAVKTTFTASFWCMVTTLLGFVSLLFVEAKPLRELGISGAVGTVSGISCAYIIYPLFLKFVRPRLAGIKKTRQKHARFFFIRRSVWFFIAIVLLGAMALPGMWFLNTDPSLFSYFAKGTELRDGLEYIDQNGGSSPLDLVVRDADGGKLTSNKVYKRMWGLQEALEADKSVGSVISLPVLMAEGGRSPLGFLVSMDVLVKVMENPQFGEIAKAFITKDRVSGHFLLRMKEEGRTEPRVTVAERIKGIALEHGFIPEMMGGLYLLQGELAQLVSSSLIFGLGRLILAFILIALIVSRSFKTSLAMVLGLCVIPISIFGFIGLFRIPVDIISSPAANVAIGMGIDAMIHMAIFVRRQIKGGVAREKAWIQAKVRLWEPVLSSMVIICAGFFIFSLSSFPPTKRFGLSIVFGTFLAAMCALFMLPALAGRTFFRRKPAPEGPAEPEPQEGSTPQDAVDVSEEQV